jgi:hypothetical protein
MSPPMLISGSPGGKTVAFVHPAPSAGHPRSKTTRVEEFGAGPYRVFISYSHDDARSRSALPSISARKGWCRCGIRPSPAGTAFLSRSRHLSRMRTCFCRSGGFEPVDNDGFTDAQAAAAAFAASRAEIAVICSTDARYATDVEQVAPKLLAAGARTVVLAGKPGTAPPESTSSSLSNATFSKSFARCSIT